ncbi:sensor histidine kinase [Adhaeribacter radiodurans]|uniref:histidine kinase n=1 Tax=Adhaeribacter radiodurans TaxID=2745197 RepID=A0A7L7L998_9BACT|nr:HAMP domain-containing sensor histidine kinase [Adhaeribacter radiodurans]QMU29085.1 HAMP domain-containing histidine kinase [Adhaeribacter radiodurans]
MKLLNYTTSYFAGILLLIITVWAGLFYYNMLDEIYDSMDDGLENQKLLVMQKASQNPQVLQQSNFDEGYYKIREISFEQAKHQRDLYLDTLMYMQNEEDFEPVRLLKTVFRQDNKYYEMRVITSMVEEDDLMEDLFFSLLWLYVGLIGSILILNNYLLKRTWQPFYYLLERLQQFKLENYKPLTLKKTPIDEFQLLNQTAEKLVQSNLEAYNSQKNFIQNASHELQTPLAISLNKLELLLESNNLTEDQLNQIAGVMQHLERLTRLNKSLLLLSKIENKQFEPEEKINLNQLLKKLIEDFAGQIEYKEITVNLEAMATCEQTLNPDLATILLLNLFKNATIHNYPGGFIHIQVNENSIVIENSGKAEALDNKQLFTRFSKINSSSSSNGLGLAIVKAIADVYHFRISYSYEQKHVWSIYF